MNSVHTQIVRRRPGGKCLPFEDEPSLIRCLFAFKEGDDTNAFNRIVESAIECGYRATVETLAEMAKSADPLDVCCRKGTVPIMIQMLHLGHDKQRAFFLVCRYGRMDLVDFLFYFVDPNVPDADGITPFHIACMKNHAEIAKFLADRYVLTETRIHSTQHTPLHMAANSGQLGLAKFLCENKYCSLYAKDAAEAIPIVYAALNGHTDIVAYLISLDFELAHYTHASGCTLADFANQNNHQETVNYLLS